MREEEAMRPIAMVVMLFVVAAPAARAVESVEAKGRVETVTLYRGQALVTRVVPVAAPAGAVRLTVSGLPEAVAAESLFASGGEGLQVRAVRYRQESLGEAPREEVRELDEQIENLQRQLRKNAGLRRLLDVHEHLLNQLGQFVAPTAQVELSQGVLDAETLEKLAELLTQRRMGAGERRFELDETDRELKKELLLLQRKRAEITRTYSTVLREAVLFLDKSARGPAELRLSYLVRNASWSPTYNLRADEGGRQVAVEFGALARQMSGEDWEGVELTLSTAQAAMVAHGPGLAPLRIWIGQGPDGAQAQVDEQVLRQAAARLGAAKGRQTQVFDISDNVNVQWAMNRAAQVGQQVELAVSNKDLLRVRRIVQEQESGLSASYTLPGRVSLASRQDRQMVRIAAFELPAAFHYEATPLLTEYVYRYAELTNASELSLLPGLANVYLDGQFVGKTNLPLVARGQKVTVGFGTDLQLRAARELVDREESSELFGGDKRITYRCRLVLENFGDRAVEVRVLDRVPVETDALEVTLGDMSDPLSEDPVYVRTLRPSGILQWEVKVPAGAAGGSARMVEYEFTLEFDEDLAILPGPPPAPDESADFDQMMPQPSSESLKFLQKRHLAH